MKSTNLEKAHKFSPIKGVEFKILGTGMNLTLCHIIVDPGATIEDHSHHNEQIGTCLWGRGELVSGGEKIEIGPESCWTIPPNEIHRFTALGNESVALVEAFSPPREDYIKMAK
jgi:quercetin dioxygenase-like cupin family protein